MIDEIGTYSFLPWLRQGIANRIQNADGDPAVGLRASIEVGLAIRATGLDGSDVSTSHTRGVALYGPGDVVGIESRALIKTEPRNWMTNFEPNYLPYVDFYDEDFPWRYTPATPDTGRLRPWITLAVLKESEFSNGRNVLGKPLPYIDVPDPAAAFPPSEELWAWAHVHVNRDLIGEEDDPRSADMGTVLPAFENLLAENPDLAYARLLSPRKLEPNMRYHAFLVPTFESGRLAGLGLDPAATPAGVHATFSAWASAEREAPAEFPYYHRWEFRTGGRGDFEYLVKLLEPKPAHPRVGRRDIDVQAPGSNISGIPDAALGGVLRLGGALQVPFDTLEEDDQREVLTFENWADPYPHPFQQELAAFVNLADGYTRQTAADANATSGLHPDLFEDPDPLITPPLYGRWHALTARLLDDSGGTPLPNSRNWVHELNLDPRWRATAGFGTKVVQQNQESYMDAAWDQVGDIIEANRLLRQAQLAKEASRAWFSRSIRPLAARGDDRFFSLVAPVRSRVMVDGVTAHYRWKESPVPRALTSAPLRRMLRPGGRLMRYAPFDAAVRPRDFVERVNRQEVTPAPPKTVPPALPTVDAVAEQGGEGAAAVRSENQTPETVAAFPPSSDFVVITDVSSPNTVPNISTGGTDGKESVRFKRALSDAYGTVQASRAAGLVPEPVPLQLEAVADAFVASLDPLVTIPRLVLGRLRLPPALQPVRPGRIEPVMAYPEFDIPMYKPLLGLSAEHFVPNINLIEDNSITLLETNQRFIEAYMVGLNHEFARELLWREFPTDQRGSYFRQFWEVNAFLADDSADLEALRESLKDIPPIHTWSAASRLGDHDHREARREAEEELVLVIRGELLKKYPNAVIYAHRARWQREADGTIDKAKERRLEISPTVEANVKTPLYEAKVDPDIYFFGFDLTGPAARGGTGDDETDDPGWFFVIQERPGEPRFGLDIEREGALNVWNDLAWPDVLETPEAGGFLSPGASTSSLALAEPLGTEVEEKRSQWDEDRFLEWKSDTNAAEMAYILFQAPVLVAIHAAEMLPPASS